MPKIIRVSLTPDERAELNERARQREIPPRVRDRLEMIRLSDLGWSSPRIAAYLGTHDQTVRKYIKSYAERGFAALPDRARTGRPPRVTRVHLRAIQQHIRDGAANGHTRTLAELVAWLQKTRGVTISTGRLSALVHLRQVRRERAQANAVHAGRQRGEADRVAAEAAS